MHDYLPHQIINMDESAIYIDAPPNYTYTKKRLKEFCESNKLDIIYIPGRLTNLLQPADVCWFAPIKKEYKKMWNHWYMNDPHAFTKNLNMKSPGYLKSSKWSSEVWSKFECETLRKSFILCGIKKHQLRGASVNVTFNPLHSVLRKILEKKKIINFDVVPFIDPSEEDHFNENDNVFT